MQKPAPVVPVSHLPAVMRTASDQPVLFAFNRNLEANLASIIRAAVARSSCADDAARLLGLDSARELFKVAAKHGVKLPWKQRSKKGGK